jgi:spore germination protein GerM
MNKQRIEVPSPSEENIKVVQLALYFKNTETQKLEKEYRFVNIEDVKDDIAGTIMRELLNGPTYENLVSLIPSGTKINKVEVGENQITLDFSKEFVDNKSSNLSDQTLTINSIVNSLTEMKEINQVIFLIDGVKVEKYGEISAFNEPFLRTIE